jgi:hypothetical protein
MHGDQNVLIYSWRPQYDYLWIGSPYNGSPRPMNPPLGRVFVVLAVENKPPYENEIVASIEHWNWVQEGPSLKGAPIGWGERYTRKLWSNS